MGQSKLQSFLRQHKLSLQTLALVVMLVVPLFLFWAAQSGESTWLAVLLAVEAASMLLAVVVS